MAIKDMNDRIVEPRYHNSALHSKNKEIVYIQVMYSSKLWPWIKYT